MTFEGSFFFKKNRSLEVQFFTSLGSLLVLIPSSAFMIDLSAQSEYLFTFKILLSLIINGICFHLQTLLAFTLMSFISPVTHR
jgi:solute carrier family 35, member E2